MEGLLATIDDAVANLRHELRSMDDGQDRVSPQHGRRDGQ